MKKLLVLSFLVVALALTACTAASYTNEGQSNYSFTPQVASRVQDEGQELRPEDVYTVKVEFVLFESEVLEYPGLTAAFVQAIDQWSKILPIEAMIAIETESPFGTLPGMSSARRRIIHVHFEDIQARPGLESTAMIGFWLLSQHLLVMDADFLEDKPELAKHVALHELGHVFGLPHISEQGTLMSTAGDITLPADFKPESFLMYPAASPESVAVDPSKLEIDLAREYVLHEMTKPGGPTGCDHFCEH